MNKLLKPTVLIQTIAFIVITLSTLLSAQTVYGSETHDEERSTVISNQIAKKSGLTTDLVSSGVIDQTLTTYGKIVSDPSKVSHIRARFPGTVTEVKVNLGQGVKKGDVLATIEANQSLNRYQIRAPFDGIITARHANPGELAQEQPLFTLADYSQLWAELKIFPSHRTKIDKQKKVYIYQDGTLLVNSTVDHILPNDDGHPFVLARVALKNPDSTFSPGMLISGKVTTYSENVEMLIANRAIQTLEDDQVVFVKSGDTYEARRVEVGISDPQHTQVLSGLNPGEEYVVDNSYIIKADLLKSGAEHAH